MLGLDPHKSNSSSIDGSKRAVVKLIDTCVIESFRAMQHEGLGKGRACPRGLGTHSQPSVHRAISDLVIGTSLAFVIENIDRAPHVDTVRAYSIWLSSGLVSGARRWRNSRKNCAAKGRTPAVNIPTVGIKQKACYLWIAGFPYVGWWVVRDSNTRPTD